MLPIEHFIIMIDWPSGGLPHAWATGGSMTIWTDCPFSFQNRPRSEGVAKP